MYVWALALFLVWFCDLLYCGSFTERVEIIIKSMCVLGYIMYVFLCVHDYMSIV